MEFSGQVLKMVLFLPYVGLGDWPQGIRLGASAFTPESSCWPTSGSDLF